MRIETRAAMKHARREVERGVLSRMLIDEETVYSVCELLEPDHFLNEGYRIIYGEMLAMFDMGKRVEPEALKKRLAKRPEFESRWLVRTVEILAGGNPVGETLRSMVDTIRNGHLEQQLSKVVKILKDESGAFPDPRHRARKGLELLEQIVNRKCPERVENPETLAHLTIQKLAERRSVDSGEGSEHIPMLFHDLIPFVRTFKGLHFGVVAGRPGQAKTAFVTSLAVKLATAGHPVGIVSAEMSAEMIMLRLTAMISHIPLPRMLDGSLTDDEYIRAARHLDEARSLPVHLSTPVMLTPSFLRNQIRELKKNHGVKLVVVDSLELLHAYEDVSRENEIRYIARYLSDMARELDIVMLLTTQLLPGVDLSAEGRPRLADLPGSEYLTAHADLILTLQRRHMGQTQPENFAELDVQIQKNRTGGIGSTVLAFLPEYVLVDNYLPCQPL